MERRLDLGCDLLLLVTWSLVLVLIFYRVYTDLCAVLQLLKYIKNVDPCVVGLACTRVQ